MLLERLLFGHAGAGGVRRGRFAAVLRRIRGKRSVVALQRAEVFKRTAHTGIADIERRVVAFEHFAAALLDHLHQVPRAFKPDRRAVGNAHLLLDLRGVAIELRPGQRLAVADNDLLVGRDLFIVVVEHRLVVQQHEVGRKVFNQPVHLPAADSGVAVIAVIGIDVPKVLCAKRLRGLEIPVERRKIAQTRVGVEVAAVHQKDVRFRLRREQVAERLVVIAAGGLDLDLVALVFDLLVELVDNALQFDGVYVGRRRYEIGQRLARPSAARSALAASKTAQAQHKRQHSAQTFLHDPVPPF